MGNVEFRNKTLLVLFFFFFFFGGWGGGGFVKDFRDVILKKKGSEGLS